MVNAKSICEISFECCNCYHAEFTSDGGEPTAATVENAALEVQRNASDPSGGASYNSRKTNEIWLLGEKSKSGTLDSVGLARDTANSVSPAKQGPGLKIQVFQVRRRTLRVMNV